MTGPGLALSYPTNLRREHMRIVPVDNVADDGAYCDGCGQDLVHGESALVPDRELAHEEPETPEAERVQDKAFALCLGCACEGAQALDGCAFDSDRSKAYAETFRALRDLRAVLPMLTGRVVTPAEQIVLDAAARFGASMTKPRRAPAIRDAAQVREFLHGLGLARAQGWKP